MKSENFISDVGTLATLGRGDCLTVKPYSV